MLSRGAQELDCESSNAIQYPQQLELIPGLDWLPENRREVELYKQTPSYKELWPTMLWRFGVSALMPFGPASLLGVERFDSDAPLELLPGDDDAAKEQIIRAIYRQVLGNAYVMDSERQVVIESQFKLGEISVREFVRRLAKSDLYRTRFFETARATATSN